MDRPEIILAPGPTPIPPEVLLAQGSPLVYHRGPGFGRLMRDVTARLKELYRTERADVLLMTSSGTGGLESAVQNVFSPGDEVLIPLAGFFSERWRSLATAMGLTVRTVDHEWGEKVDASRVADELAAHPVKAVLLTHSETSTGVIQPVEELARVAQRGRRHGGRGRGEQPRRGAVRVRRLGDGRGRRRLAEGAVGEPGDRVRRDRANGPGTPTRPRPCRGSTSTGRSTGASPSCPIRRTRGRRRSA